MATSSSSSGGSSRSGRELISTAVSNCGAGGEDEVGVERRLGRLPIRRPVQWPRMSTCGLATASIIRCVICERSIASFECTLATTTSSRASSRRRGRARRPRGCRPPSRSGSGTGATCSLRRATSSSWSASRCAVEAVGDRQAGRVVGQHHVLVAEVDRRRGHRLDRRAAVAPGASGGGSRRGARRGRLRPGHRSARRRVSASSLTRYDGGSSPFSASAISRAVASPMPSRSVSVPLRLRSATSSGGSAFASRRGHGRGPWP